MSSSVNGARIADLAPVFLVSSIAASALSGGPGGVRTTYSRPNITLQTLIIMAAACSDLVSFRLNIFERSSMITITGLHLDQKALNNLSNQTCF